MYVKRFCLYMYFNDICMFAVLQPLHRLTISFVDSEWRIGSKYSLLSTSLLSIISIYNGCMEKWVDGNKKLKEHSWNLAWGTQRTKTLKEYLKRRPVTQHFFTVKMTAESMSCHCKNPQAWITNKTINSFFWVVFWIWFEIIK